MKKASRTLLARSICLVLFPALLALAQGQPVSRVVAWGDNSFGQTNLPPTLTNVVAISSGFAHNLAVRADGTVGAWGYNSSGQANVPVGLSAVRAVAAGYFHSLALKTDGGMVSWGYTGYGLNTVPANLTNGVAIGAGAYHNLVIKADGKVAAWGDNSGGQLNVPVGLSNVVAVAGGLQHSLALRADGTVVGWGNNSLHQIDLPAGLSNVVALAAGNYHNLALRANGTVIAWGYNNYGQINVPLGLSNVVGIACGAYHSLAQKGDGVLVGWGNNSYGQARPPAGLADVAAISAGNSHSLALAGSPPAITAQPRDLSVVESAAATFIVGASGCPAVRYQWRFNGTNLAGATDSTFTLSQAHLDDAGPYSVRVSNGFGAVTSAPALLAVSPSLIVRCADAVVSADANCVANASVDDGSSDPAGGPLTLAQIPPGPYPLGTNTVTLIATDERGASASCTARVIVLDRTSPQLSAPRNIVAMNDLDQCGAVVTFPQPAASDACSAVTLITCVPPPGSFFPVGTTIVQCAATDAAGNVAVASFAVTVRDGQPPTLICPADVVVTNAHNASASVINFSAVATDNCPGLGPVVCSPPSGSAFAPGISRVSCLAADAAGNSTSCSFQVAVWPGNQPPVPIIELAPLVTFPGRTNLTVLAANGTNADVVCDGSKSYDPDDPSFLAAWFVGTNFYSSDLVAGVTLPLGLHAITLVLDDTLPYGRSAASVQLEVLSPEQAIGLLETLVTTSGLTAPSQRPLLAILDAAVASAQNGNLTSELNQLGAFENKVLAQLARTNPTLANELLQAAQQLLQALSP